MVDISRLLGTTSSGALAKKLDAADGSEDGWINASIWNQFIQEKGGKTINEKISIVDAMKSITTYAVKAGTQLGSNANAVVDEWIKPENIPTSRTSGGEVEGSDNVSGASSDGTMTPANNTASSDVKADEIVNVGDTTLNVTQHVLSQKVGNSTVERKGVTKLYENGSFEIKKDNNIYCLRNTDDKNKRFYYDNTNNMHYFYNTETNTFEQRGGITRVFENGKFRANVKATSWNNNTKNMTLRRTDDQTGTFFYCEGNQKHYIYSKKEPHFIELGFVNKVNKDGTITIFGNNGSHIILRKTDDPNNEYFYCEAEKCHYHLNNNGTFDKASNIKQVKTDGSVVYK